MSKAKVYLIPTVLQDDESALKVLPFYIIDAVKECQVFFVENERTARRGLKKLWKAIEIDQYKWYTIHKQETELTADFIRHLKQGNTIGIISEAGCPGIADPGQVLIQAAQEYHATVIPLVGPSAILLALMASGMNGQCFQFVGYLPVDASERKKAIKEMEAYSLKKKCTQIFIETPYRNNPLIQDVLQVCNPQTSFCIAVDLTASTETIKTSTIAEWRNKTAIDFHKRPAIYLLYAG